MRNTSKTSLETLITQLTIFNKEKNMNTITNDKKKSYATVIQLISILYAGLSVNRDEFDDETNISDFLYNSLQKQFGTSVANEITDMVIDVMNTGLNKKQNIALTNLFRQFRKKYNKVDVSEKTVEKYRTYSMNLSDIQSLRKMSNNANANAENVLKHSSNVYKLERFRKYNEI